MELKNQTFTHQKRINGTMYHLNMNTDGDIRINYLDKIDTYWVRVTDINIIKEVLLDWLNKIK